LIWLAWASLTSSRFCDSADGYFASICLSSRFRAAALSTPSFHDRKMNASRFSFQSLSSAAFDRTIPPPSSPAPPSSSSPATVSVGRWPVVVSARSLSPTEMSWSTAQLWSTTTWSVRRLRSTSSSPSAHLTL
jgi:hypothetical protein